MCVCAAILYVLVSIYDIDYEKFNSRNCFRTLSLAHSHNLIRSIIRCEITTYGVAWIWWQINIYALMVNSILLCIINRCAIHMFKHVYCLISTQHHLQTFERVFGLFHLSATLRIIKVKCRKGGRKRRKTERKQKESEWVCVRVKTNFLKYSRAKAHTHAHARTYIS